ncbi:uncharacterized protein LOC111085101 [Limulus polyphemus]|uniref:Uncharacterized protein LOC111085101 n=1 Tax=Limulus polyphemus TaxID=6850 RepID=A0ABM1S2X7_LIMPO|nr:uncharacterized protein LOC111085101 [Limulus polyphemus]
MAAKIASIRPCKNGSTVSDLSALLPNADRRQCNWVTQHIHNIPWKSANINYPYLWSVAKLLRENFIIIYTKGRKKVEILTSLLKIPCYSLELLGCMPRLINLENILCHVHFILTIIITVV